MSPRASSIASNDTSYSSHHNTNANAALLGATTAFGRPAPQQRAPAPVCRVGGGSNSLSSSSSSSTSNHGALAAATTAGYANNRGRGRSPTSRSFTGTPLLPQRQTTSSIGGQGTDKVTIDFSKMPSLVVPRQQRPSLHDRSPSQQAAVLASARAKPAANNKYSNVDSAAPLRLSAGTGTRAGTAPKPAIAQKPRRLSIRQPSRDSHDHPTDTTSIAPTTSLVNLFEQRANPTSPPAAKRPEPIIIKPDPDLPLKSPKPVRSSGLTSMLRLELGGRSPPSPEKQTSSPTTEAYDGQGQSSEESYASASEDLQGRSPPSRLSGTLIEKSGLSPAEALRTQTDAKRRPQPSPSVQQQQDRQSTQPMPIRSAQLPTRPMSAQSDASSIFSSRSLSIPAQYNAAHSRKMTPLRTGDDLANAIVASSLASSRAPSPFRLEPPPVPHRRRKGSLKLSFSRTPSPPKHGMLHTLRKPVDTSTSEDEDEKHPYRKHQKKRHIRKHPNKHHEGSRKRWRDALTERERKRYEGVWAANKGLHLSFTQDEQKYFSEFPNDARTQELKTNVHDQVSNIVVREIWSRSRLPQSTMEMVWALVDRSGVGRLQKEEFVVGMWLIDQRLKGRKLPPKVTDSVWASVKGVGIKVRRK